MLFDDENVRIRETILMYVIYKDPTQSGEISPADVCSCRLVRKSWYKTVNRLLNHSREPFYNLRLTAENSNEGSETVQQNGKALDQFINRVIRSAGPNFRILPFRITTKKDFYVRENHPSLSKCLCILGKDLVELDMEFPADGGSMPIMYSFLLLLKLKTLRVNFRSQNTSVAASQGVNAVMGHNFYVIGFVQTIMMGCPNLKVLEVYDSPSETILVPFTFGYMVLPESLSDITLWCAMTSEHLQVLATNALPTLTELDFLVPLTPFENGLIFKVLKKVRKTLQKLFIRGNSNDGNPRTHTFFRFPRMRVLKRFTINSIHCELESDHFETARNLPVLDAMILYSQTVSMFKKWTKYCKFVAVRKVALRLEEEHFERNEDLQELQEVINIDLECMHLLHRAFPNVWDLELMLCGTDMKGLELVFQQMRQLKRLKITLIKSDDIENSDHWDALLIGIPVDLAAELRESVEFWNVLQIKPQPLPSIKLLTQLETLELLGEDSSDVSLISDAAFEFAFLKMPKLQKLVLDGRFLISAEMTEKWKSLSRQLIANSCWMNETYDSSEEIDEVSDDMESSED